MKNILFYKIKRIKDKWAIVFLNGKTEEYKIIKNDTTELRRFLDANKESVLIGANNYAIDDKLLTSLVKNGDLVSEVTDEDITNFLPITLDVTQGIVRNSLIDFHNMISSLWDSNGKIFPYNYALYEEDMVKQLLSDVTLIKMFSQHEERNAFLNWKLNIINEYNLPKNAYHYSYGDIMREILGLKLPQTENKKGKISLDSKLVDIINKKNDSFLNDLLEKIKKYYQSENDYEKFSIKIGECLVKFTNQGILGSMEHDYIDINKHSNYAYLYIDFNSFGPNILINNNWLDSVAEYPYKYSEIKNRRIALKSQKNIQQLYYKYLLNSGLDFLNMVNTKNGENIGLSLTITGIMTMMSLYRNIEKYKAELIECNTDGLIVKCPKKMVEEIKNEVDRLASELNLSCDVDVVNKIVHFDTKNYIMQFKNGTQKHLGDFGLFQTHEYYCSGISCVEEALREYYMNGIPVGITLRNLRNNNDLRAFQIVKRQRKNEKAKYIKNGDNYCIYDRASLRLFAVKKEGVKTPLYVKNNKDVLEEYKVKRGKSVKDGYYYFDLADQELPMIRDIDLTYYINECYKVINKHPIQHVPLVITCLPKKNCIIDIDGTLIKEKNQDMAYMLFYNAVSNLIPPEDINGAYELFNGINGNYLVQFLSLCKKYKGYGTLDNFAEFLKSKELFPGQSINVYKQFVTNFLDYDKTTSMELETFNDSKLLLNYLKSEGYNTISYSNWFKKVQEAKIGSHQFDEYIKDICTIDDYYAKSSVKGWKDLLTSQHISEDDSNIMIGNSTNDLVPASLKIPTIIVDRGKVSKTALEKGIIVSDFSEIVQDPNFYSEIDKIKKLYKR